MSKRLIRLDSNVYMTPFTDQNFRNSLKKTSQTRIFYRTCDHAFKALGSPFEFYKEKKKSTVKL